MDLNSIINQLCGTICYHVFPLEITKLNRHLLFMLFFPSWCSSSRQRMGRVIFWRLVPGRREITGQVTSPLWSTSCGQPEAARWRTRKTMLDPSYTTSIWGEPCKLKFAHRLFSIVRILNPVFSLSYPAFVSFEAKCWTPCTTSTVASTWATTWSRAALTATVSQVSLHNISWCLLGSFPIHPPL